MASPLKQFVIEPYLDIEIMGYDLSLTNSAVWMIAAVAVSSVLLYLGSHKKALVPGRMQSFAELLYEFVAGLIRENLGPKGRRYFPFVFTIFVFVLMGNVLGLIPMSFTYTSHIIVTGVLALLVFFVVLLFGFLNHGLAFLSILSPPGVPAALKPIIIPIELLSFMIRPFTLAIRLFANMMAGHMVLKIFAGFSVLAASAGTVGVVFGLIPVFANVAMLALELLVACLQAYVFAILTCVYLNDSIDLHH